MTEVLEVASMRSPGAQVVDIGEPLDGRRHFGQRLKLCRRQMAFIGGLRHRRRQCA